MSEGTFMPEDEHPNNNENSDIKENKPSKDTEAISLEGINSAQISYAGFWVRFAAFIIDLFAIFVFICLIGIIILVIIGGIGNISNLITDSWAFLLLISLSMFFLIMPISIYFFLMTGRYGATLGKMLCRIKVVDNNYQKLGYKKAFVREILGNLVSILTLGIGYIWAGFDEHKQNLNDKIAKSYVIITESNGKEARNRILSLNAITSVILIIAVSILLIVSFFKHSNTEPIGMGGGVMFLVFMAVPFIISLITFIIFFIVNLIALIIDLIAHRAVKMGFRLAIFWIFVFAISPLLSALALFITIFNTQ